MTKAETLFHRIAGGLPNAARSKMFPFVRSFEILSALVSVLYNLFVLHLSLLDQVLQIGLVLTVSVITIRKSTDEWVHKALSVVILITLVVSIIIEWNVWLIE